MKHLLKGIEFFFVQFRSSLHLTLIGQVEDSDLLDLPELLLIRLNLALQLVDQRLHALLVISAFFLCEGQLLDPAFHLGHHLLSTLESSLFDLSNIILDILDLGFQRILETWAASI